MGDMLYLADHDYTDVCAKADLINGVLRLRRGSWIPQIGDVGGAPVVETMDLVSEDVNENVLEELAKIDGLLESARTWPINPAQSGGTWLEWGIDAEPRGSAETGYPAKRAWVYDGKLQLSGAGALPGPFLDQKAVGRLALRRHPLWENLEPVSDVTLAAYCGWGDVVDLTGLTEMGTAPARIQEFQAEPTYGSFYVNELWAGFRSVNRGWSEFDPLWELENGTNGTDTSDALDATASGGYHCVCTFSTEAGLDTRVSLSTNQAHSGTTHWDDFSGRYMVLLRAKVGSSTECGIVLRLHSPTVEGVRYEEVYLDNTAWKLIELGEVVLPIGGARAELDPWVSPRYNTFSLDAERLSGSGSLYMDCLYLIPTEHYFHAEDASSASMIGVLSITDPMDNNLGWLQTASSPVQLSTGANCIWHNWHLPTDLAFMVVAGQETSGHNTSAAYDVYLTWVPRWRLFRTG